VRFAGRCQPRRLALAAWLIAAAAQAGAAEPAGSRAAPAAPRPGAAPSAPVAPAAAPGATVLETLAARAGVKTCLRAVRDHAPALSGPPGTQAVVLMMHPVAPDTSAFGVSIERAEPNRVRLLSATFAPTVRGGCDVSYDMVDTWSKSCEDVARQDLRYMQPLPVIGRNVFVLPVGPTNHVYLMPAPGGCVTIGKEVMFPPQ